ncbi:BTB/POZ protein [Phyllosticta capitalensis]|uniref:BTB/POZ protein n=1 Tax=Phyllosticta capitalensis TaxID=121624 RepID=A0ABR1YJ00_9PEZI
MDVTFLLEQLKTGDHADVVIVTGTQTFRAHAVILVWKSTYFRKMLSPNNEFREYNEGVIILHEESPVVFGKVLDYIYSGEYPQRTQDGSLAHHALMYRAGDYFGLDQLKDLAKSKFFAELKSEDVQELVCVVETMYSTTSEAYYELKDMFVEVAADHLDVLLKSPDFKKAVEKFGAFSSDLHLAQANIIASLKARFGGRSFYCRKCVKDVPILDKNPVKCRVCHRAPLISPPE